MFVKKWFLDKNFDSNERYCINTAYKAEIIKESKKAICIKWFNDLGNIISWIPKTCLMSESEALEEYSKQETLKTNALNKHELLVNWCKENGIKGVRKNSKKINIINKIKEANKIDIVPQDLL